ncbi:MAG TPA: efflux RND transporter periplasmic adaptor subunit [Candidatus Acidoferrales bacterium]|nr:efflux RND transporter periplasmic adaptor subunit [Candidatus Acidoferrales bacterium]
MSQGRKAWGAILGLALAAGTLACGQSSDRRVAAETDEAVARQPAPATPKTGVAVSTGHPSAAATEILSVLTVEHQVDVLAQRDGEVMSIDADEGSSVRQGHLLAQLDDRSLRAQLAHDQDDLAVANDNVKYNEAELRAKQANYRRYQELRQYGLSSAADLEKARFEAEGAQYDLDSWKSIVKRTQAQIRIAELAVEQMQIRAPFDGVVARRFLRQGQEVAKGEPCFRVTQLRPLQVRFPVAETSPHGPRLGERVQVALAGETQGWFEARIVKVGPVVDPASGSWDVLARLVGPIPESWRPGMAVKVIWPPEAGRPAR